MVVRRDWWRLMVGGPGFELKAVGVGVAMRVRDRGRERSLIGLGRYDYVTRFVVRVTPHPRSLRATSIRAYTPSHTSSKTTSV